MSPTGWRTTDDDFWCTAYLRTRLVNGSAGNKKCNSGKKKYSYTVPYNDKTSTWQMRCIAYRIRRRLSPATLQSNPQIHSEPNTILNHSGSQTASGRVALVAFLQSLRLFYCGRGSIFISYSLRLPSHESAESHGRFSRGPLADGRSLMRGRVQG